MSEEDRQEGGDGGYRAEVTSRLEPIVIDRICRPLLQRLPESIHPNSISLTNHAVSWLVALLAIASVRLLPPWSTLVLLLAGVGTLASMVLDNLDGMQARRTNRCSKLGEVLDHWLDAIHVPLTTAGIVIALQLDPWAVVVVHVTNAMIYNAQVVLYHQRGVFVHPPTAGTDAQAGVSLGYPVAALVFWLVPRDNFWLGQALAVAAAIAVVVHTRQMLFFYRRLGHELWRHLPFVGLCAGLGALYLWGAIDALAFVLAVTFLSFRLTGTLVLHTLIGRRFYNFDWGIVAALAALALATAYLGQPLRIGGQTLTWLAHPWTVGGHTITVQATLAYLPYLAFLYMVGRNLISFTRHFAQIRPPEAATDREKLA